MRSNRSDKYQHAFREINVSHEYMVNFKNNQSMNHYLNPYEYSEDILNLEDELHKCFWVIANETMTENQKNIITLYLEGKTQIEIAKILNVNQSSITKAISGNKDYARGKGKSYGGVIRKLKKAIACNEEIQVILKQIEELREEKL